MAARDGEEDGGIGAMMRRPALRALPIFERKPRMRFE